MKDNGEIIRQQPDPQVLIITLTSMGQIEVKFPQNNIVALGMLEFAHEFLMNRVIRPTMRPAVQAAERMPLVS